MYTSSHAWFSMISVLHSLKNDTVFLHIFNTIYWKPSHRKIYMQWVHWVHFYLDGNFILSWFSTPISPPLAWCFIRVVRSPNFDAHNILIRTILIRYIIYYYLLNFVYFVGLGDRQSWIVLKLRRLTTTVRKLRRCLRIQLNTCY